VFDDDTSGNLEAPTTLPSGVCVGDVVIRELLALKLFVVGECSGGWMFFNIKRRVLMRILAIA
jgi:hypothetical protein